MSKNINGLHERSELMKVIKKYKNCGGFSYLYCYITLDIYFVLHIIGSPPLSVKEIIYIYLHYLVMSVQH